MRQDAFVARHGTEWADFERWLDTRGEDPRRARRERSTAAFDDAEAPARYRRITQHLALALRRGYSPPVTARLQALARRGHAVLYRAPAPQWRRVAIFLAAGFPRLVREEWRCMLGAAVLLYLPMAIVFAAILQRPELSSALFDPDQLAQFERMYDPADATRALGREAGTDVAMFGHYIFNNISIAFRAFASGALAAVGAVVVLVANGLIIGGVAGHLQAVGHGDPFWRFVCGHAAFELTAIVISGGAGLQIGLRLLAPGQRRRIDALAEGGRRGALLCAGVFVMLVVAAFIEAFWSSVAALPASVKFGVAALLWLAVGTWLLRGGRGLPVDGDAA
ncbi:stage II sporulation protein M [Lysobacter xanthus]